MISVEAKWENHDDVEEEEEQKKKNKTKIIQEQVRWAGAERGG